MSLHAIVFDFDGVIADSERLHLRAYQDVLRPEGMELSDRDYYDRYLGYDDLGVFRELGKDRGWTPRSGPGGGADRVKGPALRGAGCGRRDAVPG